MLSPWHVGIAAHPSAMKARSSRMIINHRILASFAYAMLRESDQSLPAISYDKYQIIMTRKQSIRFHEPSIFSNFVMKIKSLGQSDSTLIRPVQVSRKQRSIIHDASIEDSLLRHRNPLEAVHDSLATYLVEIPLEEEECEQLLDFKSFHMILQLWLESVTMQVLEKKHQNDTKRFASYFDD
jgi:hypothetical protein